MEASRQTDGRSTEEKIYVSVKEGTEGEYRSSIGEERREAADNEDIFHSHFVDIASIYLNFVRKGVKEMACICSNNVDIITPLGLDPTPIARVLVMSMNFYESFPKIRYIGTPLAS